MLRWMKRPPSYSEKRSAHIAVDSSNSRPWGVETGRSRICEITESSTQTRRSVRQLLLISALIGIGYACIRTLSFTVGFLNFVFVCAFYATPLLAIRPVLRLQRRPRIWGLVLLSPVLLLSSFLLLGKLVLDGILGGTERIQVLQTFQEGRSTIQLQRYENGGAVGIHGLNLEQRRLIVPGLYVVRSVDFFDDAFEGTLSEEGPYKVRVIAKGSYNSSDHEVDRVYSLKPWVYF
jgi:hypothetical protein